MRREVACENSSHTKCPIPGLEDTFECVDTQSNVESCGGCANAKGVDCTAIKGAGAVACRAGSCVISCVFPFFLFSGDADCLLSRLESCDRGFTLSLDGKSCESFLRYQQQP